MTIDRFVANDTISGATGTERALRAALDRALEDRRLLTHPFYRRWEAGELTDGELTEYAAAYRPFEAALPELLDRAACALWDDGQYDAAAAVDRNLADELGTPEPHLALFDRFATAVADAEDTWTGAVSFDTAAAAGDRLAGAYRDLAGQGPVAALSAVAAYELQASAIATTKAAGLRRWYGVDGAGAAFWDVHATLDAEHGEWVVSTLAALGADPAEVEEAARRAADAWWAMLDDRQAAFAARAA